MGEGHRQTLPSLTCQQVCGHSTNHRRVSWRPHGCWKLNAQGHTSIDLFWTKVRKAIRATARDSGSCGTDDPLAALPRRGKGTTHTKHQSLAALPRRGKGITFGGPLLDNAETTSARRCRSCESPMPNADPRRDYCSIACRNRSPARVAAAKARYAATSRKQRTGLQEMWLVCMYCHVPFLPARPGQHCPNPECIKDRKAMATRAHAGAQRVRNMKIGEVEQIRPIEVFQRDNWTCHICGGPTSRNIQDGRRPDSPTIDHVVPVGAGGAHTYLNLRTAHFRCNDVRGNHTVEEGRELVLNGKGIPEVTDPIATSVDIRELMPFGAALADVPRQWEGGPPEVRRLGGLD